MSGQQSALDVPASHGAALAASQINAGHGVLGRKLSLSPVDGKTDLKDLKRQVETSLKTNSGIVAYFGLADTDNVLAAAPPVTETETVFLTSGATSPKLPDQVPGYLFLACFSDNVQAAAAAEWANTGLNAKTAVILADMKLTYPRLLQDYFSKSFTALGGKILGNTSIDPKASSWPEFNTVGADVVFLSVETADDAVEIIKALREDGFQGPIIGGDGYDEEEVWSRNPDIGGVYFSTHVYLGADASKPEVVKFREAYEKAYPGEQPTAFSALAYDTVGLLAAALRTSGTADKAGVLNGLLALKDYDGVTGKIRYPDESRIPLKSVSLVEVSGGKLKLADEILPTSVPAP